MEWWCLVIYHKCLLLFIHWYYHFFSTAFPCLASKLWELPFWFYYLSARKNAFWWMLRREEFKAKKCVNFLHHFLLVFFSECIHNFHLNSRSSKESQNCWCSWLDSSRWLRLHTQPIRTESGVSEASRQLLVQV